MSYCRWGWAGSSVYVYDSVYGHFTCCGCLLTEDDSDFNCKRRSEMIQHLEEHRMAGHTVPQHAIDTLRAEVSDGDLWVDTGSR